MEHYIFYKVYIHKTRAKRIFDPVEIFPKQFNMPNMSSKDATSNAARDFIYALHNPAPEIPLVKLLKGHKDSLRTLA